MTLADIFTNHFLTVTRNELLPVALNGRDKTSSFGKKIGMALENAVKNPIKSLPPRSCVPFFSVRLRVVEKKMQRNLRQDAESLGERAAISSISP
jgi:hypothetical protein